MADDNFLDQIRHICGAARVITDQDKLSGYTNESRGRFFSECMAAVLPGSTQEVSDLIKICNFFQVGVVAQGGNTGTVGGSVSKPGQIIVNLERINRIIDVDRANYTVTVESGCILQKIKEAARAQQRYFPLSLGSQGSCQIGGNIATNAGGMNVIKYGNARDLVLGIEVVLGDGRILNDLNSLRKNNAGYDLKNLFIGSEGTLGIITRAIIKLFPEQQTGITALIGLESPDNALKLLEAIRSITSDRVSTFEIMSAIAMESAFSYVQTGSNPMAEIHPWTLLIIVSSTVEEPEMKMRIQAEFEQALQKGEISDAVLAQSETQTANFIELRESVVRAQKHIGDSIKHDIAVPVSRVPQLLEKAAIAARNIIPDAVLYSFGHIGDGNIHFNVSQPATMESNEFLGYSNEVNAAVHDVTLSLGGTFSAEHGIGISKRNEFKKYSDPVSYEIHQQLKNLFDPNAIMNPGKIF